MQKVILKQNRLGPVFGLHPWVDGRAIERVEGRPPDGSFVRVEDEDGKFLARGAYESNSSIRVRVWSWNDEELTEGFVLKRINNAVRLRHETLKLNQTHTGYRVFFSEADGLSGLVVDRFDDLLVAQVSSPAVTQHWAWFESAFQKSLPDCRLILNDEAEVESREIREYDLKFLTQPGAGQKTGFFFDQRENRHLVSRYAQGRRVLDLFSYTGGFSMACLKAGARSALAVDSSAPAVETARTNAELNGVSENFTMVQADVRKELSRLEESYEKFSLVVLDPPKLVRNAFTKQNGIRAYYKLNERALARTEKGGIFVTCSCSGNLSAEEFQFLIASVFRRSKRRARLLHTLGAGPDHPVLLSCPETQYLKCLVLEVMD